jgi:nucleoside-diphosphate-sugar epimerase
LKVLVTGAAGFIGRHLSRSLLSEGHRVLGVDNFITSDRAGVGEFARESEFEFLEMDIREPGIAGVIERFAPDEIFHLACPTGVHNLVPLAQEMLETCFIGTRSVLECARERSTPVLLASSAEVYGDPLVTPQTESYTGNVDPLGPRKGYEEGKRVAETLVGIYTERHRVPGHIARIFNTYGPGMAVSDTRVVPAMMRRALAGEPLIIYGDGEQTRCHAYVEDTVAGLLKVMRQGGKGRAYNLGSTRQLTVKELAEQIREACGSSSEIEFRPHSIEDHGQREPDVSRAENELGWRARTPLEDGLRRTAEDLRARVTV